MSDDLLAWLERDIKLRHPALLKFSKEALALYIEKCSLFSIEIILKDLGVFEGYLRAYRKLENSKRMEEINHLLKTETDKKKRLQLLEEFEQCCRRAGIKLRKG
ncbi:MAG TPA: hypothetical protein VJ464_15935 [Blastocatellia bacterium]|nr:hypothetical protein [Blastocatellia bacterium]